MADQPILNGAGEHSAAVNGETLGQPVQEIRPEGGNGEGEDRLTKLERINADLQSRIEKLEDGAAQSEEDADEEAEEEEVASDTESVASSKSKSSAASKDGEKKEELPKGQDPNRVRSIPTLNCVTVDEYKSRKFGWDRPHFSVDAVMADNSFRKKTDSKKDEKKEDELLSPSVAEPSPSQPFDTREPVRFIQINSQALATLNELYDETAGAAIIIYSPFKFLSYREHEMRRKLAKLEDKWAGVTWETVDEERDGGGSRAPTLPATTTADSASITTPETSVDQSEADVAEATVPEQPAASSEGDSREEDSGLVLNTQTEPEPESEADDPDYKTESDDDNEYNGYKLRTLIPEDRGAEGLKAYEDLKVLLEFYDTYVKPRWDYLRSDKVKNVRYGDLCSIFQPGDYVADPEQPQKVYKVIKITGGRPMLTHLYTGDFNRFSNNQKSIDTPEPGGDKDKQSQDVKDAERRRAAETSSDRGMWSPFHIDGYYIDFNGKEFGAVHIKTTIKYFSGVRDVKTVRPYPLRLAADYEGTRQRYINMGRRYLGMTQMSLRFYDGRTLIKRSKGDYLPGGQRQNRAEDISSQVVIDMEKAFQVITCILFMTRSSSNYDAVQHRLDARIWYRRVPQS